MDVLTIITILVFISAAFSYLNERFTKLPGTIGVVTISVIVSLILLIIGRTTGVVTNTIHTLADNIDFSKVLLDVMLGFLMFANALHFDYAKLKEQRTPVFILSTIGVLLSTFIFGSLLYYTAALLSIELPFIYCLLFGTLISPTDPIAVASILKTSNIPPRLNTIISGESLFNDGIGLVLFVVVLDIASQVTSISFLEVLKVLGLEVIGGIVIGAIVGILGYRLIKSLKEFQSIFLISISIVLLISVLANKFHASIPLAAVTAGLIIGNKSLGLKKESYDFLRRIWQLVDEVLNTILFVMIGLQLVVMPFLGNYWLIGMLGIVIILIARFISVSLPAIVVLRKYNIRNISIITWAGLRGGISIAMALRLPASPYREVILASCYFIVIFSIIVQGLTLNKVVAKAVGVPELESDQKSLHDKDHIPLGS